MRVTVDDARLLPHLRSACEVGDYQAMRRDQARALVESQPAGVRRAFKAEAGDLRGIPVIGFGVGGVSPGSSPGSPASLDRADREDRRQFLAAFA